MTGKPGEAVQVEPERAKGTETEGFSKVTLQPGEFDLASIGREIDYVVGLARAGDSRLVTLGPLLFFSTETADAWMLDSEDGRAACLARDGVQEPVAMEDSGGLLVIDWPYSYRIDGEAMLFLEHETGRVKCVLGYPVRQIEAAARRVTR